MMNRVRHYHLLQATVAVLALGLAFASCAAPVAPDAPAGKALRVCADPNNLPFSNQAGEGFENHLAQIVADALGERVEYTWWAQRRGFARNTLKAGRCDVVMGVPVGYPFALTTRPYYRSGYVLVYRKNSPYALHSLDDPLLKKLKIGIHAIGSEAPPPALALARRGIIDNVVGYSLYGDYRTPNPPARLIDAVASGDIDVALAWGPLAGYFAQHEKVPLQVVPLPDVAGPLPFQFSIAAGVRKGDVALQRKLDAVLASREPEIRALLQQYGVPLLPQPAAPVSRNP